MATRTVDLGSVSVSAPTPAELSRGEVDKRIGSREIAGRGAYRQGRHGGRGVTL